MGLIFMNLHFLKNTYYYVINSLLYWLEQEYMTWPAQQSDKGRESTNVPPEQATYSNHPRESRSQVLVLAKTSLRVESDRNVLGMGKSAWVLNSGNAPWTCDITDGRCIAPITGFRLAADGTFPTARRLVPQILDDCPIKTIRGFFRKTWRYMDAYK